MTGLICLLIISTGLCVIGITCKNCGFVAVLGGIFLFCSVKGIIDLKSKPEPTALDVYRNKTTLQITYVDSIPTDTVVVFKEEFK